MRNGTGTKEINKSRKQNCETKLITDAKWNRKDRTNERIEI
jgi:hypothetical protein